VKIQEISVFDAQDFKNITAYAAKQKEDFNKNI